MPEAMPHPGAPTSSPHETSHHSRPYRPAMGAAGHPHLPPAAAGTGGAVLSVDGGHVAGHGAAAGRPRDRPGPAAGHLAGPDGGGGRGLAPAGAPARPAAGGPSHP